MTINAIMNQYRAEKLPDIIKDYREIQQKLGTKCSTCSNQTEAPW